jgi:RNA ligase (TIGR02306 family)
MSDNEVIDNQLELEDSNSESSRKLATITTIKSLEPIEGADKIEVATFSTNSWKVVVGKGNQRVGDKVVFFEIDSAIPVEDRYAELERFGSKKVMKGKEYYRIKSVKLRGQISQGFAMPITAFSDKIPQFTDGSICKFEELNDGEDVTELLEIKLYQLPIASGGFGFNIGRPLGNFPTHLCQKTDQERIQSMSSKELIALFKHTFEVTEKLNGTSCTVIYSGNMNDEVNKGKPAFHVCSRNLDLKEPCEETITYNRKVDVEGGEQVLDTDVLQADGNHYRKETKCELVHSLYWDIASKYNLFERMRRYCIEEGDALAFQMEIVGPGVQKNELGFDSPKAYIFDIFNVGTQRYLNSEDRLAVIEKMNNYSHIHDDDKSYEGDKLENAPILGYQTISPDFYSISSAVNKLHADYSEAENDAPFDAWSIFMGHIIVNVVASLIEQAKGKSVIGKGEREGLVFKSTFSPTDKTFKVINNLHLLAQKD